MNNTDLPTVPVAGEVVLWDKELDETKETDLPPSILNTTAVHDEKSCISCGSWYDINFDRCPSCLSTEYTITMFSWYKSLRNK